MNSTDGVEKAPKPAAGERQDAGLRSELKKFPKTAEEYVAIENRLAAQRQKPAENPHLNSIFDELRGQLPK